MNPKPLKLYICLLYILIILFWGLRPFNLNSLNTVDWLKKQNGIIFKDPGIVYGPAENSDSDHPPLLVNDKSISIEIWLTPGSYNHRGFSNIFSLYDDNQPEIFSFRQVRSSLNISKYRTPDKNRTNYSWKWLGNFFFEGQRRLLTVTSDKNRTTIYFDGRKVKNFRNYSLILSKKKASPNRIVIGNDPTGTQPWKGKIHGLAIYDRVLDPERVIEHFEKWRNGSALSLAREKDIFVYYPMDEKSGQKIHNKVSNHHHLLIPLRFKILKKSYLKLSRNAFNFTASSLRDMRINIIGFIPLGFLLLVTTYSTPPSWRPIFLAFLGGTMISLMVEILQAFLPTRTSSLTDLIFNTLGTTFGVILALVYIKTKKSCL